MEKLLSTKELADILGIKYLAAYKLGKTGALPQTRIGGVWRYSRADVQAYIDKNTSTAKPKRRKAPVN